MARNQQYTDFDVSKIAYTKPKKNTRGGATVFLNASDTESHNPRLQLEKMRAPFGVREAMEAGGRPSLDLAVSSEKLKAFCAQLDENNIENATNNSEAWFKQKMSREVISQFYRKLVPDPTNPDYDPLLRVKISQREGRETAVFVIKTDPSTGKETWDEGTIDDVTENCHVLPIVEIQSLWFVQKQFGCTFVADKLLVWPSTRGAAAKRDFDFILPGGGVEASASGKRGRGEEDGKDSGDSKRTKHEDGMGGEAES